MVEEKLVQRGWYDAQKRRLNHTEQENGENRENEKGWEDGNNLRTSNHNHIQQIENTFKYQQK